MTSSRTVICPLCAKEGHPSTVSIDCSISTALAVHHFFDDKGTFHTHDPNSFTTMYRCSREHDWSETRYTPCACGWMAERPPWSRQGDELPLDLR